MIVAMIVAIAVADRIGSGTNREGANRSGAWIDDLNGASMGVVGSRAARDAGHAKCDA